ncbi:hypothetical protein ABZ490_15655 [Streptomyces sp. NPDC005811]|uniref:hypothetical protein n=1 Tax=Streptomyces sp. NPDC005811 TaxID=3154565 RepID=UPI003400D596
MTRPPTAAQRRVIDAAEPVTGRLRGTEAQLAALVRRGLAFRHPRPPHDHFLTPAGHRIRETEPGTAESGVPQAGTAQAGTVETVTAQAGAPEAWTAAEVRRQASGSGVFAAQAGTAPEVRRQETGSGVFAARVGGEEHTGVDGPARAREVHSAWQGLLELRRMTHPDGAVDRPCGWERAHLVRAAALALEAGGHRPAGPDTDGYRVRATPQPEAVAVRGPDDATLGACAATLEKAGWQVGEHTDPRTRARYLLASPRRV